jgi:cation-transporting ATPase 13A2
MKEISNNKISIIDNSNQQVIQLIEYKNESKQKENQNQNKENQVIELIKLNKKPSLLISENNIHILNKASEGEIKIKSIECLNRSISKILLFIILSILSVGIVALFAKWFIKFRKYMLYTLTNFENSTHFFITSTDQKYYIEKKQIFIIKNTENKNQEDEKNLIFFTNNFLRYVYNEKNGYFECWEFYNFDEDIKLKEFINVNYNGLSSNEVNDRQNKFGKCELYIHVPGLFEYLGEVLIEPFYIIQYLSVILWIAEENYLYSFVLLIVTFILTSINYIFVRLSAQKIKELASNNLEIKIIRNEKDNNLNKNKNDESKFNLKIKEIANNDNYNSKASKANYNDNEIQRRNKINLLNIKNLNSKELVPGDIFILDKINSLVPCDCLLLSGDALLNESMLNGESTPVPKYPIFEFDSESKSDSDSESESGAYENNNNNNNNNFNRDININIKNEIINKTFNIEESKNNILYFGTKILELKPTKQDYVLAIVLRTGFTSLKGQLVRTVVFPKKTKDEFTIQVLKFMAYYLIFFIGMYIVYLVKMLEILVPTKYFFFRLFEGILYVIPPTLTIYLNICNSLSTLRLRWKKVIGLQPEKIIPGGSIDVCCFDKTGTLTQNDIEVIGYVDLQKESLDKIQNFDENSKFKLLSIKNKDTEDNNTKEKNENESIFYKLFSCCHSIHLINNELVGDMLDIQMFKFSEANYIFDKKDPNVKFSAKNNEDIIDVLKIFEFSSDYMRMSVIAKEKKTNKIISFMKGAPEVIVGICDKNTVPKNEKKILELLSMRGFRILAIAFNELNIDINDINTISRESSEKNSIFLGYLISENKLKPDTKDSISRLREADIKIKIISGDNPLTTIQTSRDANIIDKEKKVMLIDITTKNLNLNNNENININENGINQDGNICREELSYKIIGTFSNASNVKVNNNENKEENSLQFLINFDDKENNENKDNDNDNDINININKNKNNNSNENYSDISFDFIFNNLDNYPIAITGNLLEFLLTKMKLINNKSKDNDKNSEKIKKLFDIIFMNCKVFSRMKPNHKAIIVEQLQKASFKVAMIGDGANDCSALKQADIGISFSETEASFSAPFSSLDLSINCVEKILLEGRATLLNYTEVFRYIMTIAFIKYFANMLLAFTANYMNDFQFLFGNFIETIPATVLLAFSPPVEKLVNKKPPNSLCGIQNVISIYAQNILNGIALIIIYVNLTKESFYIFNANLDENGSFKKKGFENSAITMAVHVMFIISCFTFVITKPFKKRIYHNIPLFIFLLLSLIYNTMIIFDRTYMIESLDFVELSKSFNLQIFLIVYGFGFLGIIFEEVSKYIIPYFLEKKEKLNEMK